MFEQYSRAGYWKTTTPSDIWHSNGRNYPDREAVVDSNTRITWR